MPPGYKSRYQNDPHSLSLTTIMAEGQSGESETHQKLYDGYKFDRNRVKNLFDKLDANNDGHIDVAELSKGLKQLGVEAIPGQVEVC